MLLAGCASVPPEDDPVARAAYEEANDPLEPLNRGIFTFNQGVDTMFIRPAAEAYRGLTPRFARDRVNDALDNLGAPLDAGNNLLQGDFRNAGVMVLRLLVNTTFGVFGIMDVATPMGLVAKKEDFGQTLAVWGIGEGPYLVLPLLGPSNPRDAVGFAVDSFLDPVDRIAVNNDAEGFTIARTGVRVIAAREEMLDVLDDIERTSLDYYSAIRSLYRQRRDAEIRNGAVPGPASSPGHFDWEQEMEQGADAADKAR